MPIYQLDRREIKAEARALIRSGSVSPLRMTGLFLAIALVLELIDAAVSYMIDTSGGFTVFSFSFVSILVALIALVLNAGYTCYCFGIHRRESMPYESLFDAFSFAGKVILLSIVEYVFIVLWSLLFIIPGVIAAYRYSFAVMNLCENPELGVMEALNLSKRQTFGYKWQLFVLQLSFIGWALLAALIAGLAVSGAEYLIFGSFDTILSLESAGSLSTAVSGALIDHGLSSLAVLYLAPYMQLSICGFYLRATAPRGEAQQPGWNGSV